MEGPSQFADAPRETAQALAVRKILGVLDHAAVEDLETARALISSTP
jgi:hypothetical protein